MPRSVWIRRVALTVGALLLLMAVAAAVLVATFDANRYKGLAIDRVRAEYQRDLSIDGPIELSVLPRLAVKVSKLRLSERASPAEFAAVDEASLALQWWPLLSRRLVVDRVSARGVRALYRRNAQGASNIDDLLKPRAPDGSAAAPPAGAESARFGVDISRIALEDLQLRWRDDLARRTGQIDVQSFMSGRLASEVPTPIELRATLKLTQPQALQVALDGRAEVALNFQTQAVSARDLTLKLQGDAAGVQGLVLQLAAKGLAHDPAARRLRFDALALSLQGRTGAQPIEATLDWPRLAIDGDRLDGSALSGRAQRGGAQALSVTFRSEAPSGSFEAVRLPAVALTFQGSAGARKFDGKARADLLLRPPQGAYALERLELSATLGPAGAAPLAVMLRGQAGGDAKAAQWALEGALAGSRFESKGSAAFGAGAPAVRATARFDSLDLNPLLGNEAATASPGAAAESRISLDGLRSVNGQFNLTANTLAVRQYRLADARLDASLDNGMLRIPRLAARAWGGSLEGSGSAQAGSQRIGIKMVGSGVDVNALLKDVAGKDLLEGRGRVQAELSTAGADLGLLRSNLAGTAAVQLRDGAIKGINLARSLRQAKAALSGRQDALTRAQATEKTDFSELNISARIADGVARSDDLDLKSPFLRIGGAGSFDIGRGRIDYTARATVVPAAAGQDAGELAALRGVTVPVLLSGPFEAIDWKIQWSGVAAAAVENKLKDKLAEKLGAKLGLTPAPAGGASAPAASSPKDQLKDRLKGLFK